MNLKQHLTHTRIKLLRLNNSSTQIVRIQVRQYMIKQLLSFLKNLQKSVWDLKMMVWVVAVRAAVVAVRALRANTRNHPSAYLGRNRVRRDGVEKGEKHPEWKDWVEA